jgi:hypothetical protein
MQASVDMYSQQQIRTDSTLYDREGQRTIGQCVRRRVPVAQSFALPLEIKLPFGGQRISRMPPVPSSMFMAAREVL